MLKFEFLGKTFKKKYVRLKKLLTGNLKSYRKALFFGTAQRAVNSVGRVSAF